MISNRTLLAAQASVLALAMAATAAPAFAQTEVEELVVTARKRDEALIDVPFSIAAQSEQMMRDRGVTNIEELSRGVAGFTKTVIPAKCIGKFSLRLVPDQDPNRIDRLIKQHLETKFAEV